jgi:hypothetical protein
MKSTKHHHPSSRETPNFNLQTARGAKDFEGLEFVWMLKLGIWNF